MQPRESLEEVEEKLVRKKRRTNPSRALEFLEGSELAKSFLVIEVDYLEVVRVWDAISISVRSPTKNV